MKHRHNGRYWSRTPKGRWTTKRKPLHSLMRKYKNKPYPYLRRRFRISKMGDDDGDKVPNYKDCRPWDRKRQDLTQKLRMQNDIKILSEEIDELDNAIETLEKERDRMREGEIQAMDELSRLRTELSIAESKGDAFRWMQLDEEIRDKSGELFKWQEHNLPDRKQLRKKINELDDKRVEKQEALSEIENLFKEGIWK